MELGKRIKTLRMKRGITQEALAGALGVTPQTVSKWENDVTMPDITLLPELSIFFGITIDELFSLTAEKQMERIDNRIAESELIDDAEARQMEEALKAIAQENCHKAEAYKLIAVLHNHQAEVHRRIAAGVAREAMELEPCNSDIISEYANAMGSFIPDWNMRNHHELIQEFKVFLKEHPESRSASMWLLDNLMADGRVDEAEKELEHLKKVDDTFRTELYCALIARAKGDKAGEMRYRKELEEKFGEDWLVQLTLADMDTCDGKYEEALNRYQRGMELQDAPRFCDAPEAMAHIYEILGQKEKAVESYRLMLKVMKDDWGMIAGEEVERVNRRVKRLMEK